MGYIFDVICIIIGVLNMNAAIVSNNTPQAIMGAMICVFSSLNIRNR